MNEKDAVYVRIASACYTAEEWTKMDNEMFAKNGIGLILYQGETGYESDTKKFKIGDGQTRWIDLPYYVGTKVDPDDFNEEKEFIFDCGGAPISNSN